MILVLQDEELDAYPSNCDLFLGYPFWLNGSTTRKNFYEQNTERVDIALWSELISSHIFRVKVPDCPFDFSHNMCFARFSCPKSGKPEIRHFGPHPLIQKNVRWFHISVDYLFFYQILRSNTSVKIKETKFVKKLGKIWKLWFYNEKNQ